MNRKDFMLKTGAALLAFTLPVKNNYAFETGDEHPLGACIPTTTDILGPYYRAGAPFRTDIIASGDTSPVFHFKGLVKDEDCNPLANAMVDVWQADSAGAYDNSTSAFNYRGRFQTGADGQYSFRSVKPGWYLNGAQYRPAHIHFRVTKAGYTELITQLYFTGDPYIADDPWASEPEAALRIVPINNVGGESEAVFEITLQGGTTAVKDLERNQSPVTLSPNPVTDQLYLQSGALLKGLEIFSVTGQLIASAYRINKNDYRMELDHLRSGIYFCRIATDDGIFVHRFVKR